MLQTVFPEVPDGATRKQGGTGWDTKTSQKSRFVREITDRLDQ